MAEVYMSQVLGARNPHSQGNARVRFFDGWKENQKKSKEAGRPIFDPIDKLRIEPAEGDVTERAAEMKDRLQYPEHWKAYQELLGAHERTSGTPLREWALMRRYLVEEFAYMKIHTVEELAALPDEAIARWQGFAPWVKTAQTWLESANTKQADLAKAKTALEAMQKKYDKALEQISILQQRIEGLEGVRFGAT